MFKIVRTGKQEPKRLTARQREVRSASRLAWSLLVVCALMSMAFNIRSMATLSREPLALVSSVAWPTVGVIGLKLIMFNALWGKGKWWNVARYGLVGGLSLTSMVISMSHTYSVLTMWGVDRASSIAGPLVLDIVMVLAGVALMNAHRRPATSRRSPASGKSSRSKGTAKRPAKRPATREAAVPQLAVA
jgi:hypothetical protein